MTKAKLEKIKIAEKLLDANLIKHHSNNNGVCICIREYEGLGIDLFPTTNKYKVITDSKSFYETYTTTADFILWYILEVKKLFKELNQ